MDLNKEFNNDIFYLNSNDIILGLTLNNTKFKNNITTLVGKIFILKEDVEVNLNSLSRNLSLMGINGLNIFYIVGNDIGYVEKIEVAKPCLINLIKISAPEYIKFLSKPGNQFSVYNKDSLYILKNSNYMDVKILFDKISTHNIDIGRGSSQKSHIISPLEFRISCYLMCIFNFQYNKVCYLNHFNTLNKTKYLPYIDKKHSSFLSEFKKNEQ